MARTIQVISLLCLLYTTNLLAGVSSILVCTPTAKNQNTFSKKKLAELNSDIQSSLLYEFAMKKSNKLLSCQFENDDSGITITYNFQNSMVLKDISNPEIEYNSQILSIPSNLKLVENNAIELLKFIEKKSFGETGCGIDWNQPTVEQNNNTTDKTWWGDTCNCKGNLLTKDNTTLQVSFQTAC